MKNNTASNSLDRSVIRARFEAITEAGLNRYNLYQAMTYWWSDGGYGFRDALREAFRPVGITCDMRKNSTWEALASAIAAYEALSSISEPVEPEKQGRGTNDSLIEEVTVEGQKEGSRGTNHAAAVAAPVVDGQWHLDDPDWRDARVMQMGEWHPHFKRLEWKFRRCVGTAPSVFKEYATLLLSETTDSPEDLRRHLHEEVVTYLANKLVEAVDDAWRDAIASTVRPDSPVWEFEELIEECKRLSGSLSA